MTETAPVALVTGGAQRIGAEICRALHAHGYRLALHYRNSHEQALQLAEEFNAQREASCQVYAADLADPLAIDHLCRAVLEDCGPPSLLVNNASLYYKSSPHESGNGDWEQLIASNLRGPYLLMRTLQDALASRKGSIVNILDAHSKSAAPGYAIYDMSKNGLASLTRSLARELAPEVRVNGVAPGMILWPESRDEPLSKQQQQNLLDGIPMGSLGTPADIAGAVLYLAGAGYVTGEVLVVDGGRSLA